MKKSTIIISFTFIFIILIIIIIFHKYYFDSNVIFSDVLCVGAGVSSAYMCYKLYEDGVPCSVNVIESQPIMGGRVRSVYSNIYPTNKNDVIYGELGGMRIFEVPPMKKLFDLMKKFNIKLINVNLEDKDNIFFYKGVSYKKKEVFLSTGENVIDVEKIALNNLKQVYPNFLVENAFDYEELRYITLKQYFQKFANLSDADYDLWLCYYGYNYFTDDVQVTAFLYDSYYYNTVYADKQFYLKDGMITLVRELFKRSNANITYNTNAIYIEKDKTNGLNIVYTINNENQYKKYISKYLVLGITPRHFNQINIIKPIPISKDRLYRISQLRQAPLFKCFLKWNKEDIWWGPGKKFHNGKSTTDLLIRQVHYYSDEDILVYNIGSYANKLNEMFIENPAKAQKYIFSCIQKMHPFKIPEPNYVYTIYKFWPDGASKWILGSDVNESCQIIPNGITDNSNIFVVSDAYSKTQGWVIGCFDSVDVAYPLLKNQLNKN